MLGQEWQRPSRRSNNEIGAIRRRNASSCLDVAADSSGAEPFPKPRRISPLETSLKLYYSAASPFVRKCLVAAARARPARPHRARPRRRASGQSRHGGRRAEPAGQGPDARSPTTARCSTTAASSASTSMRRATATRPARRQRALARADRAVARRRHHGRGSADALRDVRAARSVALERLDRRAARKGDSGLDALEARAAAFGDRVDLGTIAFGCALGYLDFRFCVARLARHAATRGRVVRAVRRTAVDGRHSADIGAPHPIAGTGNAAAGRDIQWS